MNVETAHGIRGEKNGRRARDFTADKHLLHVAAGETAHGRIHARRAYAQLLHHGFCQCAGRAAVGEDGFSAAEGAEHHIVGKIHVADKSHAETVLRDEGKGDAELGNAQRIFSDKLFAGTVIFNIRNAAGFNGLQTGDRFQKLFLTTAGNAGNTEDLAAVGGEGNIVELDNAVHTAHRKPLDLNARLGINRIGTVDIQ